MSSNGGSFVAASSVECCSIDRLKAHFFASVVDPSIVMTKNDTVFLRFLRGANHDEALALKNLLFHQDWRIKNDVDNILTVRGDHINRVKSCGVFTLLYDNAGRPTNYGFVKRQHPKTRCLEDYFWFIIHVMERILREGDPIEQQGLLIMDLGGFGLSNMDYELVKILFSTIQTHYPEVIHRILFVDAPLIFSACWSIVRNWVDQATASKVMFIKAKHLIDYLIEDQIPSRE
jgi:hypothetical protein